MPNNKSGECSLKAVKVFLRVKSQSSLRKVTSNAPGIQTGISSAIMANGGTFLGKDEIKVFSQFIDLE